jgi:hypothetical protein
MCNKVSWFSVTRWQTTRIRLPRGPLLTPTSNYVSVGWHTASCGHAGRWRKRKWTSSWSDPRHILAIVFFFSIRSSTYPRSSHKVDRLAYENLLMTYPRSSHKSIDSPAKMVICTFFGGRPKRRPDMYVCLHDSSFLGTKTLHFSFHQVYMRVLLS